MGVRQLIAIGVYSDGATVVVVVVDVVVVGAVVVVVVVVVDVVVVVVVVEVVVVGVVVVVGAVVVVVGAAVVVVDVGEGPGPGGCTQLTATTATTAARLAAARRGAPAPRANEFPSMIPPHDADSPRTGYGTVLAAHHEAVHRSCAA
ncbi:MAG: hypothetical protein GY812_04955 [Actinomycetia bacterium]|nr:hypothetical protein [Actinomycetes bacterium]